MYPTKTLPKPTCHANRAWKRNRPAVRQRYVISASLVPRSGLVSLLVKVQCDIPGGRSRECTYVLASHLSGATFEAELQSGSLGGPPLPHQYQLRGAVHKQAICFAAAHSYSGVHRQLQ